VENEYRGLFCRSGQVLNLKIDNFGFVAITFFSCVGCATLMADETLTIDDRSSGGLESTLGSNWRIITDGVMGGLSNGELSPATIDNKACLRLQGDVSLKNSGGFIQAALDIESTEAADASTYTGLLLEVYGNDQEYNLHLRTGDVWLPWQSYRASFRAAGHWHAVRLPFDQFTGYRIGKKLDLKHLKRIGLVAIGRAFTADLCVAEIGLYRDSR
jgi:hypothetical protein